MICTIWGKHGDIFWAMATVRAISETLGMPVNLVISEEYGSVRHILEAQPYVGGVATTPAWEDVVIPDFGLQKQPILDTPRSADIQPLHLSYVGWPDSFLARVPWNLASIRIPDLKPLDLDRPWIKVPEGPDMGRPYVAVGFGDEWFEIKFGIWMLLLGKGIPQVGQYQILTHIGSRWEREAKWPGCVYMRRAQLVQDSAFFFGSNNGMMVLANAMGKRTLICEPCEARWNPIFWHEHPRNKIIKGLDGRPTFDARHVGDELRALGLEER